ncbi:UPF0489 [Diplonema papillatum]|nr:UPF0489 [Diplonema papillatum]
MITEDTPLLVVDEHGDCLRGLDAVGSVDMMLHFDSHPDMDSPVLPRGIARQVSEGNMRNCAPYVDVATWILPLIMCKKIEEVTWIAPDWSEQMQRGEYHLVLSCSANRIMIAVNSTSYESAEKAAQACVGCADYWKLSGAWVEPSDTAHRPLQNYSVPFTLRVISLDSWNEASFLQRAAGKKVLIDVDEDYFSCANPAVESLRAFYGEDAVRNLKTCFPVAATDDAAFLNALDRYISQGVFKCGSSRARHPAWKKLMEYLPQECERLLKAHCMQREGDRVFGLQEILRFADMHELPHRISSAHDINVSLTRVFSKISGLLSPASGVSIAAVVVAQSVADGYTPAAQASFIHRAVVESLSALPLSFALRHLSSCNSLLFEGVSWTNEALIEHPRHVTYELVTGPTTTFPHTVAKRAVLSGVVRDVEVLSSQNSEEDEEGEELEEDELPFIIPWEAIRTASCDPPNICHVDMAGYTKEE